MAAEKRRGKILLITGAIGLVLIAAVFLVLLKYGNRIVKAELERRLGKAFSIEKIEITWGHVEAAGIRLRNAEGRETVRIDHLSARADFLELLRKEYVISNLTVKGVYLLVETNRKGDLVSPALPPGIVGEEEKKKEQAHPLLVRHLTIEKGAVDYVDARTAGTPITTKIRDITLDARDVVFPPTDKITRYEMTGKIPGNAGEMGSISSSGTIGMKKRETESKIVVRHLDITGFRPYFQKDTNVIITRGFLDVDMTVKVASRKLNAPGHAVLANLEFRSRPGAKNQFLGVPLTLVVAFLKRSGERIPVDFTLTGDLDNPRLNVRENFINDLSRGLAEKLGLSLKGIGQTLVDVGSGGAKGVGEEVRELGKGLKRMLTK